MTANAPASFSDLGLTAPVLKALNNVGYETPSPIQALTIPYLLQGRDVVGQAQTGTGKTAAFALPLLSRIEPQRNAVQVLVLTPTRELAIQVAEAFQRYASQLPALHVLPIYGGQSFDNQLKQLKRGPQIIVGTPGRVMDHMRRRTLKLDNLSCLVLDEADEMLRMGFIEDVEWILEQTPGNRQIALFSATMPPAIRKIAERYLNKPEQVTIDVKTVTADTIRQRYWLVNGMHKLDALTRILEVENFDSMIVFVRTKNATVELADKLQARGYAATALNGDINQTQRERIVEQLRKGVCDILVATDVAARGLDVERVSHVINFDIPYDTEAYVHRIGRTGRAGRSGDAILFVAPREKRMLNAIERATQQKIQPLELPSTELINNKRIARFKQRITETLEMAELGFYRQLLEDYQREQNIPALDLAAALAKMVQGDTPLLLTRSTAAKPPKASEKAAPPTKKKQKARAVDTDMEQYRLEVGRIHDVTPSHIVGAIANEAGLESQYMGRIEIFDNYSVIELPQGMPKEIFRHLKKVRVVGQPLNISLVSANSGAKEPRKPRKRPAKSTKTSKQRR